MRSNPEAGVAAYKGYLNTHHDPELARRLHEQFLAHREEVEPVINEMRGLVQAIKPQPTRHGYRCYCSHFHSLPKNFRYFHSARVTTLVKALRQINELGSGFAVDRQQIVAASPNTVVVYAESYPPVLDTKDAVIMPNEALPVRLYGLSVVVVQSLGGSTAYEEISFLLALGTGEIIREP